VAAVYLGAAEAARDLAVDFARNRRPTALDGKPIATLPHIRDRAGRLDLLLYQARGLLVSTARVWDQSADPASRAGMDGALAAAKVTATNLAVEVADQAMRLVGGSSMDRRLPLEQFFRDVRGGLNHPPQDDLALEILARAALDSP
jgi:alkylation response protein AidB-like acyl-CoA dehydrogenase